MNFHDVMEMVKSRASEFVPKQKVEQPDPQNEAIKQAWAELMSMPAWKDFMKILDEVNDMPLSILDEKSVAEVNLVDAGFIKGVRSAVKTIKQKINGRIK